MQQGGDARWEEFDKHDAGFAPPPAEYNAAEWQSPPEDDFYEDGTQFSAGAWAGGVTQGFKDLAGGVSSTVQGLKTYDFKAGAKDVFKMPSKADFEARINGACAVGRAEPSCRWPAHRRWTSSGGVDPLRVWPADLK
jgi:hypothetical protein